jgi:cysteine synthase A
MLLENEPLCAPSSSVAASAPPVVDSAIDLIGSTPMVRLTRIAPAGRADIYAKLEFMSPGGSVKDRLGLGLILAAEEKGELSAGATIVEPTAGNTGIGLALVGVLRGYRVVLVVPEQFSIEKVKLMEALGGTVVRTPAEEGMQGAIRKSRELAEEIPGAYLPMQFENPDNAAIHYRTTAREIWHQLDGRLDAAVIGVGTGGTFSGVARFLKDRDPEILCVAVEPNGSILTGGEAGPHEVEGIGVSFIPESLSTELIDECIMVHDDDSFAGCRELARREGLLVGGSSGANFTAALAVARRLGPGRRVVTVFPDTAERYLSKGHV